MENTKKSLQILIISYDWKNIWQDAPADFLAKLERDNLKPETNYFFHFAWSTKNYHEKKDGRFETVHLKTSWRNFKPLTDFLTLFFAPWYVKKYNFKPDVIIIYDLGYTPAALIVKWLYQSKIVLCLTNMPKIYSATRKFGLVKSWYSAGLEKMFVRFIDIFYTINLTMKNYLLELGAAPEKIYIFASNTISRDLKNIAKSRPNIIRQKLGIGEDQKIILTVGRLEAEKGYPELLRLFAQLDENFVLVILGRGSLLDPLKNLAEQLGIAKRVIFAGYVNREEIWNFYQDADLLVLLSKAEALGLVFWEAMYMRVPVIGSPAPGIVETVGANEERGIIFDWQKEDAGAFKKKVDICIVASQAKELMLDRAKRYVAEQIANDTSINDLGI